MKRWTIYAILAACVLQSAAIAYFIWGHYEAQLKGKVFLFQTEPVDPRDYFRGQYVALSFAADNAEIANDICQNDEYQQVNSPIYVQIQNDAQGIAQVRFASQQKPDGDDYLTLHQSADCRNKRLIFELPFERYYANENEAQPMEIAARKSPEQTFLQVFIYRGRYAVEKLILPPQN